MSVRDCKKKKVDVVGAQFCDLHNCRKVDAMGAPCPLERTKASQDRFCKDHEKQVQDVAKEERAKQKKEDQEKANVIKAQRAKEKKEDQEKARKVKADKKAEAARDIIVAPENWSMKFSNVFAPQVDGDASVEFTTVGVSIQVKLPTEVYV